MNTLALLCNLHADGPATLQRLRRAGCESLPGLSRFEPAELARCLDWSERAAERFLREALLLAERLDEDVAAAPAHALQQEEEQEGQFELESSVIEELSAEGPEEEAGESEVEEVEEYEEEEEEESGFAPAPERVQAVLGAWRELDRVDPPRDPADFVIPRQVAPSFPDRPLGPGLLEGLNPELSARLAVLGVRTLRALATAEAVELARSLPLGFTRLKHLQFLATRELATLPAARPVLVRETRGTFEPFIPPPVEPFETAGPFA